MTTSHHPGSPRKQERSTTPGARDARDATGVNASITAPDVHYLQHLYYGGHHKAVDVEVAGQWYDGELRSWDQADDRSWSGVVTWRRVAGEVLLDRFPASRIRAGHRAV